MLHIWVAQGFGTGLVPVAPGTVGSLAGLLWFGLLIIPGNLWVYLGGMTAGFAASVWLCGSAEEALQQRDPSSVVLDEITAVPLCFAVWIGWRLGQGDGFPTVSDFVQPQSWWVTLLVWGLFRFFDVVKPWPVRQSQALPGGWGVTVDDFLAAIYVNLVLLLFLLLWPGLTPIPNSQ